MTNGPRERSGCRRSVGRLFYSHCPAAERARSHRCIVVRCNIHVWIWTLEDRSCRRLVALIRWQPSDRYGCVRPFQDLVSRLPVCKGCQLDTATVSYRAVGWNISNVCSGRRIKGGTFMLNIYVCSVTVL